MSSEQSKPTGLGTKAFFAKRDDDNLSDTPENTPSVKQEMVKVKKVRTTLSLYPETLAAMELMKFEVRKKGRRNATMSDVVKDAVDELMKIRGIDPTEIN